MKITELETVFEDDELKEIFSLFTCGTKYEKLQIYDKNSEHYYKNVILNSEYSVTEEKREIALDAWRSIMFFLHRHGYSLYKNGSAINLKSIEDDFSG